MITFKMGSRQEIARTLQRMFAKTISAKAEAVRDAAKASAPAGTEVTAQDYQGRRGPRSVVMVHGRGGRALEAREGTLKRAAVAQGLDVGQPT